MNFFFRNCKKTPQNGPKLFLVVTCMYKHRWRRPRWSGNPENTFPRKADLNLGGVLFMTFIHISNRLAIIGHTKSGGKKYKKVHPKSAPKNREKYSLSKCIYDFYSYLEPLGHNHHAQFCTSAFRTATPACKCIP